jgi:hypothetical protein
LSFNSLTMRQRAEHGERYLGADALHGLQQPKPFPLMIGAEAEQFDLVLADVSLDREHRGLAGRRQGLQRARGAMHLVADAADVEDDIILAVGIDQAFQLADHGCDSGAPGLPSPLRGRHERSPL